MTTQTRVGFSVVAALIVGVAPGQALTAQSERAPGGWPRRADRQADGDQSGGRRRCHAHLRDLIGRGGRPAAPAATPSAAPPIDTAKIAQVAGHQGEQIGAVYKITVGRDDVKLTDMSLQSGRLREHG